MSSSLLPGERPLGEKRPLIWWRLSSWPLTPLPQMREITAWGQWGKHKRGGCSVLFYWSQIKQKQGLPRMLEGKICWPAHHFQPSRLHGERTECERAWAHSLLQPPCWSAGSAFTFCWMSTTWESYWVVFYVYFKKNWIPHLFKRKTVSRCGFTIQTPPQPLKIKCRMNKIKQLKIIYFLNFL